MKHGTRFWQKKLNRSPEHRRDMLKNLITSLVIHEQIQTTLAKAKYMARSADLMIENAKKGLTEKVKKTLYRQEEALPIIMEKLVPRYKNRTGGYTRILRNGFRASGTDRAPLAIVEFVDCPKDTIHRLAQVQLPALKENLKKLQTEKYTMKSVQLFDPVTGEPMTVIQKELKRGLNEQIIKKLDRKERGIQKLIDKYERSIKAFPLAREKDGVVVPTLEASGINQALSDLSLEPQQADQIPNGSSEKIKQIPDLKEEKEGKGWFKWF